MSYEDPDELDPAFSDQLVAFEEALAAGEPPTRTDDEFDTAQLAPCADRLRQAQSFVKFMDHVWSGKTAERAEGFESPGPQRIASQWAEPAEVSRTRLDSYGAAEKFDRFGRFEIVRELGRGGCGIVFLARDPVLKRLIALKLPRPEALVNAEMQRRFLQEAQAAALLEHVNIVSVYEVERVGAVPYIASAYCRGPTLAAWLKDQSSPVPALFAAELVSQLAEGVAHAHSRGVLHRDIKPANVLLQKTGTEGNKGNEDCENEGLTHGNPNSSTALLAAISSVPTVPSIVPKLTDFGLAKLLEGTGEQTRPGTVMGTARYMAPEQAEGRTEEIGTHTDVYALGVILYEVLCGRPPFTGETELDTLRQISSLEPEPARRLRPDVPRDLDTICSKCLSKHPRDRYHDADSLAADLDRFLDGLPIQGRPIGRLESAARWAKRRPAAAALIAFALLAAPAALLANSLIARSIARTRANELVASLLAADIASVPHIAEQIRPVRPIVEAQLRRVATDRPHESRDRLRAALALLPDRDQERYLMDRVLRATPDEIGVICSAFSHCSAELAEHAARVLADGQASSSQRLRAACVAAQIAPDQPPWERFASEIVDWLVAEDGYSVVDLARLLTPIRDQLTGPLQAQFHDATRPATLRQAATVLAELNADDSAAIVSLLVTAAPVQFPALFAKLEPRRVEAVTSLEAELASPVDPRAPKPENDALAGRHARAAVACFRLGLRPHALELLRASPGPRHRTATIELLSTLDTEPAELADAAAATHDDFVRSGLTLALGNSVLAGRLDATRAAVVALLTDLYENDPDPGVHSAAEWSLRRLRPETESTPEPVSLDDAAARGLRWYTAYGGHTMALFAEPDEFEMGSALPASAVAPDGSPYSPTPLVRIRPAPFAIALKETTVAQLRAWHLEHPNDEQVAPDSSCPVTQVSFRKAAAYCNWLSREEGLPTDQWCFVETASGAKADLTLAADFQARFGYRLPTEAEWEYACRAGTRTSRFFGETDAKLSDYAWFLNNSNKRAWPVGLLRPNGFGLFDVYGNVAEWCINSRGDGTPDQQCLRGFSFVYPAWRFTSAERERADASGFQTRNVGFRIARSLPCSVVPK